MEILTLTSAHPRWNDLAKYAENCSWRAGPELARLMRAGGFLPWERVFAALSDGEFAGFCTLSAHDELPEDSGFTPFIGFVFVDERFRGQRLSGCLVNAAGDYARSCGFEKVYIMSGEAGLYEKYGFRKIGDYPTIYGTTDQLFVRAASPSEELIAMKTSAAKAFIVNNARPLDRAVYKYFFENGPRAEVVAELAKFQNPDGGFGNALEADNWNPNSNPIATNDALITLYRVGALNEAPELIAGMLRYLASGDSFDTEKRRWLFAIESNKDYPHARWWEKNGDGIEGFNPTVSLAAFMVCFGARTPLYEDMLREAVAYLQETSEQAADPLKCYLLAYSLLETHGIRDIVDLPALKALLTERIEGAVCRDTAKYGVEYVPLPSDFFPGLYGEFISEALRGLIAAERAVLPRLQQADGGFDISWQWYTPYPEEFQQARTWWRARITIDKLLFCGEDSAAASPAHP